MYIINQYKKLWKMFETQKLFRKLFQAKSVDRTIDRCPFQAKTVDDPVDRAFGLGSCTFLDVLDDRPVDR